LNNFLVDKSKYILLGVAGFVMIVLPGSFLSIMIFTLGVYLIVLGVNSMVSSIILIKFRKGWAYEGIKAAVFTLLSLLCLFQSATLSVLLSSIIFVIIGVFLILTGVFAIFKAMEKSTGITLIIIGSLFVIFPMGFSYFIIRIIGLAVIGVTIIMYNKSLSKSS